MDDESSARLEAKLERGHRRVDSAAPGSPEWDAAQANVDALEQRLLALRPLPTVGAKHVLWRLGPMVLDDGCLVQGILASLGTEGEAVRLEMSAIPDRVHARDEFVAKLQVIAERFDFVLEVEGEGDLSELRFYAWDRELHQDHEPAG